MDWFSWLSRTNLHPSLIYQYGLIFSRNELQQEDISYFNHEFLLSMGISIAKHRLEILKLAKKTHNSANPSPVRLSRFFSAIKKCVNRLVLPRNSAIKALPEPEPEPPEPEWVPGMEPGPARWKSLVAEKQRLPVIRTRRQAKSGPLDGRVPENLMVNQRRMMKLSGPLDGRIPRNLMLDDRKMRLSGPLDGNSHERLMYSYRSPKLYASSNVDQRVMIGSGGKSPRVAQPLDWNNNEKSKPMNDDDDDLDDKLLWAALFQDMKPT